MKSQKTNLDPIEREMETAGVEDSVANRSHKPEVRLGREAQARIGELLRGMYNTYISDGVPDHLADLVRRLGDHE